MDRTTGDMIGQAVDYLYDIGVVWSTGFGKSACTARLFAEDLSTLTIPAGFIHGGDLLHGGMGRIGEIDALVIFSASGQGHELERASQILKEKQRCRIVLVTTNADAKIARHEYIVHSHGDTVFRYLNCPTLEQMKVARHLAEAIAVERGIKGRDQIAWAHPANSKPTFVGVK